MLLAEGSLINAVVAQSILRRWNLKIDIVRSGNEAVEKVKDMRYDILLLGIKIAGMDALEAAKQIRSLGYTMEHLPILVLATHTISADILSMNSINDIILKPFSVEEVERKFNQYVKNDY